MANDKRLRSAGLIRAMMLLVAVLAFIFLVFNAYGHSTLVDREVGATLVPSDRVRVTGVSLPSYGFQVTDRHIVLCQLVVKSQRTYECRLTDYTTTTDKQGRFELTQVEPGEYLVLYDSGLADFDQGLRRWKDTVIHVGDRDWLWDNKFFADEPSGIFVICGARIHDVADFYVDHFDLALCASGSPFVVAHDVEAALKYKRRGDESDLPPGIFSPVVVKVTQGYSSHIEFSLAAGKVIK